MDRSRHLWLRAGFNLVFALLLISPSLVTQAAPAVSGNTLGIVPSAGPLAPDGLSFPESLAGLRMGARDGRPSVQPALNASPSVTNTLFLPLISGPAFIVRPPNPVDLTMALDSSRATTATLSLSGGTLTVSEPALTAEGSATAGTTVFQLTIPPDALLYTTTIVMTPISSVAGLSPTVHFIAGVHIEPEGLRLFNLATLTVTLGSAVPVTQQVPIASSGLGQSSYLYPLQLGTPQIVFRLMHFSEHSMAQSETGPIPVQYDPNNVPMLPEDQYMSEAAQLVQQERAAQLSGQPGDPNYVQKLEQLSRGYYQNVLLDKLNKAVSDCQNAQSLLLPAVGWSRQMQVMGFGAAFASEIAHVNNAGLQALEHCWSELKCVHWKIPSEVKRAFSLARQLQLMGGSGHYDPFDLPECPCGTITSKLSWSGQMSLTYNRTASSGSQQVTVIESSGGSAQLTGPSYAGNLTGSANASYTRYLDGQLFGSFHGGPLVPFTPPNTGSHMTLYLHPNTCTYLFWMGVRATVTWNDNSHTVADVGTVVSGEHPLSDYDTVLSGGGNVAAHSSFFISASNLNNDYFVGDLITNVAGENAGGNAQVSWSFTPGP
jgi:hypothetical protein